MTESVLPVPPDQAARDRIATDLSSTLFVEAGAGSGKTTALVGRVVALVASGAVELAELAAITFTEKAGAELRDRVRQELQARATDTTRLADERARCHTALRQLDGAAIGTLHSFAQRILTEHPVEAQLPPRVEVLDEVSSGIAFERRWARVRDEILADPALERTLLLLTAADIKPDGLRALARAFDGAWDLVEERVPGECPEPPALAAALPAVLAQIHELESLAVHCTEETDKLLEIVQGFADFGRELAAVQHDDLDLLEKLTKIPKTTSTLGKAPAWGGCKPQVIEQLEQVVKRIEAMRGDVLQGCAHHLASAMRRHTLDAAHARRTAGQLEFHDLLVLARKVLNDPTQGSAVRASLHQRYRRLLLDEFQDTDPIQIELAVRIAAADPANATAELWSDVVVEPGRLFVVGDPKQSIYRFRRADITTFLEAKARFSPEAGGTVELSANFRTVAPVIDWVNTTFSALMGQGPEIDTPVASQPAYQALLPQRSHPPSGPPVAVLGLQPHPPKTRADEIRTTEAADVAHAVVTALREAWPVRDGVGWRPARLGDITILVPARTSLPFLEDALDAAGIAFRAESSSLVYASRAVRDLMMVLRAADDPTDHLAIVAALRTPLLACGDDDLFRHKVEHRRSWSYNSPDAPDPALGVVSAGLAFLRGIHQARHWQSPAELLDRIARDRRALELGFVEGRPRDVWRRLRFVIDQARAWSEAAGGSLRAYLQWVGQQTTEGARVTESVLPETDDDAVRIMTIHAAKGLEFPITIVSGMSTGSQTRRSSVDVVFPRNGGTVGYRLGKNVITDEFEAWRPIDEQMGFDERIRLLYVACTRACDHLVVSLHRKERAKAVNGNTRTNAELLLAGMGPLVEGLPDLSGEATPVPRDPAVVPDPPTPFDVWEQERAAALAVAARPGAVAATALADDGGPDSGADVPSSWSTPVQGSLFDDGAPGAAAPQHPSSAADDDLDPGLQKRPRDLDLPPWLKGRYGTAIGRAVHGVLQTIDLATGDGMEAAVAAQCQAEAVPGREADVTRLVQAALAAPTVQEAAVRPHWREVYACTPVEGRLLEGYVDLLYRGPHGLVVVDHKTSASADPAELDRRVAGYRLQGAAYAVAVGRSTGERVDRVVFLFLTPHGPVERELSDLPQAMADVERLVIDGDELISP